MKKVQRPGPQSWRKRLWLHALIIVASLTVIVGVMVLLILRAWAVPLGDYDTVYPLPSIKGIVAPITPGEQLEKHTCGFHAVSSIYRSYGLDPEERRLRSRLGVDNTANVYDSETTGCLHPDIFRVLAQDGFLCATLDLEEPRANESLKAHLDEDRFALALIKRRENGNMHWVVVSGRKDDHLLICDSLKPDIGEEPLDDWWNECLLSLILVTPSRVEQQTPVWRLHLRGAKEMYRAFRRK